jgi:hypothetical protein
MNVDGKLKKTDEKEEKRWKLFMKDIGTIHMKIQPR